MTNTADPHWMQSYVGKAIRLPLEPSMLDIEDIAHSLANQCRYNGHCQVFYSVAEHSVLIARWLLIDQSYTRDVALAGLFHDAEETYVTDVPRPLKPLLPTHKPLSKQVSSVIAAAYSLDFDHPAVVEADHRILEDEKRVLMVRPPEPWFLHPGGPLGVQIQCWDPVRAEAEFLGMFCWLGFASAAYTARVERWAKLLAQTSKLHLWPNWRPVGFWRFRRADGIIARSLEQTDLADKHWPVGKPLAPEFGHPGDPNYAALDVGHPVE